MAVRHSAMLREERDNTVLLPVDNGGVTRCYNVVITDAGVLYTVNGVANANEHGPFQTATTATKKLTCLFFLAVPRGLHGSLRMSDGWLGIEYGVNTFLPRTLATWTR